MIPPLVLVASPSIGRQHWYQHILEDAGYSVTTSSNAMACAQWALSYSPTAIIVETSIRWGGVDGLLALMHDEPRLKNTPVIVIDIQVGSKCLYQLSLYEVYSIFLGSPPAGELLDALASIPLPDSDGRIPVHDGARRLVSATCSG